MKKLLALAMALIMVLALCACSSTGDTSAAGETAADDAAEVADAAVAAEGGSAGVFWYTFSDVYLSSVRGYLDSALDAAGIAYTDYDGNSNQTTQTEQIQTAIASGVSLLIVNVVDTGSNDAAQNIVDMASQANIPLIFFNRSVEESVVESYDKCVFVGTNYEEAGHMQGQMIGEYLVANYDAYDLNGDGVISYVMFKGQEGNMEAEARTQYGVEDANAVLIAAGYPELSFYDASNTNKYLVDTDGNWSAAAASNYMTTILAQYNEANNNMVELFICNNDDMANGTVQSLQGAGYNTTGATTIPVFGVDATDVALDLIDQGAMAGTIKQDAEGMANAIATISGNFLSGADTLAGIDTSMVEGTWKVAIPYGIVTGDAAVAEAAPAASGEASGEASNG